MTKQTTDNEPYGKRHLIYQGMATASASTAAMVAAMAFSYPSPALPSMRRDPTFTISKSQEAWVGAAIPTAAMLGGLAAGPMVNRLGRRTALIISSLPFALGWAIIATAADARAVLVGRLVCGMCVGLLTVSRLALIPETIRFEHRKIFFPIPALTAQFGILMTYQAGYYLSWRGLAWLGAVLSLPIVPLAIPVPETPYYLTRMGKRDESLAALKLLRSSSSVAETEQREVDGAVRRAKENKKQSMWELAMPPNRWAVFTGLFLLVAQQTTGHTAVQSFASTFMKTGTDDVNSYTSNKFLDIMRVLGIFVSIYGIRTYPRRKLIQMSSWMIVASLLTLSAFFWAQEADGTLAIIVKDVHFIPVTALVVYLLGFSLGWGPVPFVFLGEGLPSWVRGEVIAFVVSLNYAASFLVGMTLKWSASVLGPHSNFLVCAVATAMSSAIIVSYIPETYRKRFHEVDQIYLGKPHKKTE